MECRFCKTELEHVFIDLVSSPASNSFLTKEQLNEPEAFYPLKVFICHTCFLVQVDEYKKSDAIFSSDYVYFSSYSTSWLKHASDYVDMMTERFGFNEDSLVIELASNDGYLLQYFLAKGVKVREFHGDDSILFQNKFHSQHKVNDIGHVGQHVVAE